MLVEAAPIEASAVNKRDERLPDAVERLRLRLRELDADAHRIRSAPFPSSDCKARLREYLDSLANRGTPDVSALVEHFADVGWPRIETRLPLVAIGKDGSPIIGGAQGEVPDLLALFAWLHRPALLKALDGLIDAEADDTQALSASDREVRLAESGATAFVSSVRKPRSSGTRKRRAMPSSTGPTQHRARYWASSFGRSQHDQQGFAARLRAAVGESGTGAMLLSCRFGLFGGPRRVLTERARASPVGPTDFAA